MLHCTNAATTAGRIAPGCPSIESLRRGVFRQSKMYVAITPHAAESRSSGMIVTDGSSAPSPVISFLMKTKIDDTGLASIVRSNCVVQRRSARDSGRSLISMKSERRKGSGMSGQRARKRVHGAIDRRVTQRNGVRAEITWSRSSEYCRCRFLNAKSTCIPSIC